MSTALIITICILFLAAYVFDLTSSWTKIPSVILLLLLGWIVRRVSVFFDINIPNLFPLLPILGTIGLILIVLEGSLELDLNRSRLPLLGKSLLMALIPMLLLTAILALSFRFIGGYALRNCIINAIPLTVISSAIAIPSVRNFARQNKDFIIYESSFSDILGVLIFNFFALNETINTGSFLHFLLQLLLITIISFVSTVILSSLLRKIEHPIKFGPIIILVILIYTFSKIYHLPGLIFILFFGLFLGNLDKLKQFSWISIPETNALQAEVKKFKEITIEATFLVRALFFLLFGYVIETTEILNTETLVWAAGIVVLIFLLRVLMMRLLKLPLQPLIYIAPRGLITVLLFLSIRKSQFVPLMNQSLITQVIIITSLIMMLGRKSNIKKENSPEGTNFDNNQD